MKRAAEGISEVEIARARTQMKAGLLMGLESPSSRAERLARLVAIWGRVPTLDEVVGKIDAVSTRAVRDFAGHIVEAGRPSMTMYGPVEAAPRLSTLQGRLAA